MAVRVWNGSQFVNAKAIKVWNGTSWERRRAKRFNGSAFEDINIQTFQYPAIETRSYDGGTIGQSIEDPNDPGYPCKIVSIDVWASDTGLGQGKYSYSWWDPNSAIELICYHGPYYATMLFGSGSGKPTELAGLPIVSAQIYLRRYTNSPGSDAAVPVKIYASTLTDVPGSGAKSPNGNVTGTGTVICSLEKGEGGWFTLPNSLAEWVVAGKCLCIYYGSSNLSRMYGIESSSKPQIRINIY